MSAPVTDWPEVEDDAILQFVDNQGVTDELDAPDEARDARRRVGVTARLWEL